MGQQNAQFEFQQEVFSDTPYYLFMMHICPLRRNIETKKHTRKMHSFYLFQNAV